MGDFIDRGPQIARALAVVRSMVEAGGALAVMGNHEFNALAFHTADPDRPGEFLRPHSEKNVLQHRATLEQMSAAALADALAWFDTLPLWLDLAGLRVVHACWDDRSIDALGAALSSDARRSAVLLPAACRRGDALYNAVDVVLKGKEARLPTGMSFRDKDGSERHDIRTRWYLPAAGQSYRSYALQSDPVACDAALTTDAVAACQPYPTDAKPVFFGHYWLSSPRPARLAPNVACVDYSVAKGGLLCAYRWDGEQELDDHKFVAVGAG